MTSAMSTYCVIICFLVLGLLASSSHAFGSQTNLWQGKRSAEEIRRAVVSKRALCNVCRDYCTSGKRSFARQLQERREQQQQQRESELEALEFAKKIGVAK